MELLEVNLRRVRDLVCRSPSSKSDTSPSIRSSSSNSNNNNNGRPCVTWADRQSTPSPKMFRRFQDSFRDKKSSSRRHRSPIPPPLLLLQDHLDNRPLSSSSSTRPLSCQSLPSGSSARGSPQVPVNCQRIRHLMRAASPIVPDLLDNRPLPNNLHADSQQNLSAPVSPCLAAKVLFSRPLSVRFNNDDIRANYEENDFITEFVYWHNVMRQRHQAPPVNISSELCQYAQEWANHLAHTEIFYHQNPRNSGENLFTRWACIPEYDVTAREVIMTWYSGMKQYNFNAEPDLLHVNAGQFTQMVWRDSTELGVGKARARDGKVIIVAYYRPPGNIIGHFKENVLPQVSNSESPDDSVSAGSSSDVT